MRYVGIYKSAQFCRRLAHPLLGCSPSWKATILVVRLTQSRLVSTSTWDKVKSVCEGLFPKRPAPTEPRVQAKNKHTEKPGQMARSKARKKAISQGQAAAPAASKVVTSENSTVKVTKPESKKKKKKKNAAAAAAATATLQMKSQRTTRAQGASSQGAIPLTSAQQPYPTQPWDNGVVPQNMAGFIFPPNGPMMNIPVSYSVQPLPVGNPSDFALNSLAPTFAQQYPPNPMTWAHVSGQSWWQPPTGPRLQTAGTEPYPAAQFPQAPLHQAHDHGRPSQEPATTTNDTTLMRFGKRDQAKKAFNPSAASGGVPDPTPEYMMLASRVPFRLPSPKPILIVLDLNGTLLFRPTKNRTAFVARPHATTFINYLLSRFWVAVWSSAKPENVGAMIDNLITDKSQRDRLVAVWGRDRFGLSSADYAQRVQVYKRLTRLWVDPQVASSHPGLAQGERWDQTNTVLVDDSVEKARSEPYNLVCVPEFVGSLHETPEVLPQVHDYLNELSFQGDASSYMRTAPFVMQ